MMLSNDPESFPMANKKSNLLRKKIYTDFYFLQIQIVA
jgi:hypothetical protein